MVTVQVNNLIDFVAEVFSHSESSPEEARRIATYLTTANLTGHDSHGVIRVPVYIRWKKMGSVVPDQTVDLVVDTPSLAVIDGKFGYGQTVTPQAVKIGIEKCKKAGLSAVALRNAGHIGRVGDWAEMAAAEGLVSVHFVNAAGSLLVAPFGGVQKRLSTAPYCVGIPRQGQDPIVLDFATSIVAEGKVLVASRGGKKLPTGALVDHDGTLSEDPAVLYGPYSPDGPRDHTQGTGAIRAFGEHKGSGLAFICELLGGALTGTGATSGGRRFANGMLAFYIDPKVVDTSSVFDGEISRYVDFIRETKPVAGVDSVLIPGDPERKMRAERTKNGVPLPDDTWAAIVNTAREVGVSEASIQRAASNKLSELQLIATITKGKRSMTTNNVKKVWASGKAVVNAWLAIPSGFSAEVIAQCGFDSVTVDMQHGVQDYLSMVQCFQAMNGHPVTPMVRVPWNEPGIIGKVLDGGAYGVICPMINTPQEAKNLVQYAKYPPKGTRSNGPIRSGMYGSAGSYQQTANDEIVLLPMMETKTAIENMESILDVEGINGVYIGPSDLGFSYGLVPKLDRDEPEILKIYEKIVKECGKRGLYPGIHCSGAEGAVRAINMGFKLVTLSNESGLMQTYAKMQVNQTRKDSAGKA
jgi:uncharacterized oxidoreductase